MAFDRTSETGPKHHLNQTYAAKCPNETLVARGCNEDALGGDVGEVQRIESRRMELSNSLVLGHRGFGPLQLHARLVLQTHIPFRTVQTISKRTIGALPGEVVTEKVGGHLWRPVLTIQSVGPRAVLSLPRKKPCRRGGGQEKPRRGSIPAPPDWRLAGLPPAVPSACFWLNPSLGSEIFQNVANIYCLLRSRNPKFLSSGSDIVATEPGTALAGVPASAFGTLPSLRTSAAYGKLPKLHCPSPLSYASQRPPLPPLQLSATARGLAQSPRLVQVPPRARRNPPLAKCAAAAAAMTPSASPGSSKNDNPRRLRSKRSGKLATPLLATGGNQPACLVRQNCPHRRSWQRASLSSSSVVHAGR